MAIDKLVLPKCIYVTFFRKICLYAAIKKIDFVYPWVESNPLCCVKRLKVEMVNAQKASCSTELVTEEPVR